MKKDYLIVIGILIFGLLTPNLSYALELYDDFSETSIDLGRWRQGKIVREIRNYGGNNRLLLARTNPSPATLSGYPNSSEHHLTFVDPDSVVSFQAEVTLVEHVASGSGNGKGRIGGRWFYDGTPGGGYNGDIWAEVNLYRNTATWYVGRHTTSTTSTELGSGAFTQAITPGTTYSLSMAYNQGTNQFTFKVGTETITFGAGDGLPARVSGPNNPWKALTARTLINNADSSVSVSATFDNVYKNGSIYDSFSSGTIDSTKWSAYELATEISGGKLRSKARSASTTTLNNLFEMTYPLGIRAIQTQVTPLAYTNTQGFTATIDVMGTFFNDGTAGTGFTGDIVGRILIGGIGATPVAEWRVYKYLDAAGNTTQKLAEGAFSTPVVLGNTYTLYLEWNGSQFTFRFNDEVATSTPGSYSPALSIHPVKHPFKRLRTQITPEAGKTNGAIEAMFDNVNVEYLIPNDDFSAASIAGEKWVDGEFVREIDPVSQRLILKQASPNPIGITSFSYVTQNNLPFSDPNSVNSIQAEAIVMDYDLRNSASARIRIAGRWYNDGTGTPDTDMTGDIYAEIALREDTSGLYANWAVSRHTNASGSTSTTLGNGNFTTAITAGTFYTLYISYDPGSNRFTFRITPVGAGPEEVTFGPTGLPAWFRTPNSPWKALGTRVQINEDSSYGYIFAAFDNVTKNGAPYDSFASPVIDSAKWTYYETVREISGGNLRSKIRSSATSTADTISNNLSFLYPFQVHAIKAKVTPTVYQNANGLDVLGRISGIFYHDDTPGTGRTGDMGGTIGIGGTGASPVAEWRFSRMTDDTGQNWEVLATGTFSKPIVLGNTYNLYVAWNGSRFTFKFDDEVVYYTPTGPINPANVPTRNIGVRVHLPGGNEAMMEALFDDVAVNSETIDLVTSYYNKVLNRPPESGGAEWWTGEVERIAGLGIDKIEGFIAVGKAFFNSSEYLAKGKTDTAYIIDLYNTFLNRTPSQGEIDWFINDLLSQGVSRNLVLNNFIFSAEYRAFIEGIFGTSLPRPENTLVNDFYRGILSRLPETGGFNYWLDQMRAAQCTGAQAVRDLSHQIALGFINSNEYLALGRTNVQFVEDMYDAILRRGASPAEVNYWLGLLSTGTRGQVLEGFTGSIEFQTRVDAVIAAGCLP